jgi:hypothetical protein
VAFLYGRVGVRGWRDNRGWLIRGFRGRRLIHQAIIVDEHIGDQLQDI